MSGANDLRSAIADAVYRHADDYEIDAVMAVLADPVLRLEILDAMGLDVTSLPVLVVRSGVDAS